MSCFLQHDAQIFPIREHGVNFEAQPLNQHEIEQLQDDEVAHENILKSYEMMLDFYGAHSFSFRPKCFFRALRA